MDALQPAFDLVIGALPITVSVFLTVMGLKVFGFVTSKTAPKAAVVSGLFFGLGYLVSSFWPETAKTIETINTYLVGALSAGLFYEGAKVFLGRFGVNLAAE